MGFEPRSDVLAHGFGVRNRGLEATALSLWAASLIQIPVHASLLTSVRRRSGEDGI
ncbi:hypothetical protein [Natronosalvus amylolyticus]|uniref:hypothetical protein n=1 Tax=Natronosalvus amylolyticus TaxID=2961994 RepID=UPI0020C99DA6|nr:hypothetical protein [Natronosalvus amylolyticus]